MLHAPELEKAYSICEWWGATPDQIAILLPLEAEDELFERCLAIINIDENIKRVFTNPNNQRHFISMRNGNPPFNGATPLEWLLSGDVERFDVLSKHTYSLGSPW